jgi:hypothetical protein
MSVGEGVGAKEPQILEPEFRFEDATDREHHAKDREPT